MMRPETMEPASLSPRLDTVRRALVGALALGLAAFVATSLVSWASGHGLPYVRLGAAVANTIALAFVLRLPKTTQLGVLFSLGLFGLGLVAFEIALMAEDRVPEPCREYAYAWKRRRCAAAVAAGTEFDGRSAIEVLDEARRSQPDLTFVIQPSTIAHLWPDRAQRLLPLGTLPNRRALYCNEDGHWHFRAPDEQGFPNPPGRYGPHAVDVVLLGDSFLAGFCVEQGAMVGSVLDRLGHPSLTLAASGNGPLAELATLHEYGRVVQPSNVYLFFYENNDLQNLEVELHTPLARYLEPAYDQHLVERSDEITGMLDGLLREMEITARNGAEGGDASDGMNATSDHVPTFEERVRSILALRGTRGLVKRVLAGPAQAPYLDREALTRVLERLVAEAGTWGGHVTFVYLPAWSRYGDPSVALPDRDGVRDVVEHAGMRFLDFGADIEADGDPERFFPFRMYGHFTAEGYARLARFVADDLEHPRADP